MCEPRLKSQRVEGREREAGWDWSSGTSKRDRVAMPPEATRATEMLRTCTAAVVAEGMMSEEVRVVVDIACTGTGEDFYYTGTNIYHSIYTEESFAVMSIPTRDHLLRTTDSNSEHARGGEVFVPV